jgi:hypothetical protein
MQSCETASDSVDLDISPEAAPRSAAALAYESPQWCPLALGMYVHGQQDPGLTATLCVVECVVCTTPRATAENPYR